MNPNITRIMICKEQGRDMYDYGDIQIFVEGNGYNNGCYISELTYGSYCASNIINVAGMTQTEINWIEKTARELYNDRRHRCVDINLRTKQMRKY